MNATVFVTGASGDLGQAVMAAATSRGYTAIGFDLVQAEGVRKVDLSDEVAVGDAFAMAASGSVRPSGLVNCVGTYEGLRADSTSTEDFLRIQTSNVTAAWLSSTKFAEICEPNAAIINLSSISGRSGSKDVAYGTAKAAVIGLTKSLALAYGPDIRVNAVAPGVLESRMSRRIPDGRAEDYKTASILGRHGRTEEVAELIMTLLGPAGAWMTGAVIDINGGTN